MMLFHPIYRCSSNKVHFRLNRFGLRLLQEALFIPIYNPKQAINLWHHKKKKKMQPFFDKKCTTRITSNGADFRRF